MSIGKMKSFASLYGGFGGTDIGAQAAGLELAWSIESDAAIADVAHGNLHHRVHVANILDCDPMKFDAVDAMHASPPCTNASQANSGAGETELDKALARKTAAFVTTLKPSVFTLENVWQYRNFQSWRIIEEALHGAGYWVSMEHVNAADHGVAQTRKRMIVRAVRGGFVPYLPEPVPWVGWYAAVADLIDSLPESQFAPWQLARLPEPLSTVMVDSRNSNQEYGKLHRLETEPMFTLTVIDRPSHMPRALLVSNAKTEFGVGLRSADEPALTVTSQSNGRLRAWLVDSTNASETGQLTIREDADPAFTITSGGPKHPTRSLLSSGKVVSMTPRALARFQSFPDWYELPANARLAAKGIGNAVCPLMYQRIIAPLVEGL